MSITTLSSRAFNQNTSLAKKATQAGPVIITDRGKPAHVLLSIQDYRKALGKTRNIVDLLAMPGAEDVEMDVPVFRELARPSDLD